MSDIKLSKEELERVVSKVKDYFNDEFNQESVIGKGEMIAPDLSLSGKIIQQNVKVNSQKQQVEYYFQLTLTEIKRGLSLWESETFIGKRGSNKDVSW